VRWERQPGTLPSGAIIAPEGAQVFVGWPQLVRGGAPPSNRLYYHALEEGKFRIHAATSDDMLHWTTRGRCLDVSSDPDAFDAAGVSARCIVADPATPGGLLMFYEAQDAQRRHSIGVASSDSEGLEWRRRPGGPVLEPSDVVDSWDGAAVARPWLVPLDDGSARLYYLGRSEDGVQAIGAAQSDGTNWFNWRRISRLKVV